MCGLFLLLFFGCFFKQQFLTLGFIMKANAVGVGSINQRSINKVDQLPCACGNDIPLARFQLGYRQCLLCGEKTAQKRKFTIAPMPKSNYILITDLSLLKGLNSSHKGGLV